VINRYDRLPLRSIMTKTRTALLVCSVATLPSACGKSYSLGSPEPGQTAGGAADGQGTQVAGRSRRSSFFVPTEGVA
jgi:hypothetical protein